MKLYHGYCLLILLVISSFKTYSAKQAPVISGAPYTIGILEDQNRKLSAEQAYTAYKAHKFRSFKGNYFNAGFTASVYWLSISSKLYTDSLFFVLGNAHINYINFYHLELGRPVLRSQTGDHYPFQHRPVPDRLFVFPLKPATSGQLQTYLLRIDKHNESLQIQAEVRSKTAYQAQKTSHNLINSFLCGAFVLMLSFGLFLYLTVRYKLYLYYVGYLMMIALWVVADQGYGFQYLWPDSVYFASRARPVFNCLMSVAALHFMQAFIRQQVSSRLFRPIYWLKICLLVMTTLFLAPVNSDSHNAIALIMLLLMLLFNGFTCIAILWSVIEKIRDGSQQAWFYLLSIAPLLCLSLAELFLHAGSGANTYLTTFGMQTGLIIEALILTFGLAHRFNTYRLDREQLLVALHKKQQDITANILMSQENERRKISDQLHDEVGAMLSIAIWQVSSLWNTSKDDPEKTVRKLKNVTEVLQGISQSIRTLSHNLSPWGIQKFGLSKAVSDLVAQINMMDRLKFEVTVIGFDRPEQYPLNFLNDIYRIVQELVNNVIKHAAATHAYLELVEHQDLVTLIVEDNGRGISERAKKRSTGIGLESIHAKVAYFEGRIEIRRRPENGTIITIEIPRKKTAPNSIYV